MTNESTVSRRNFVVGAGTAVGAVALGTAVAACSTDSSSPSTVTPPSGAPAGTLAALKDIPVGEGAVSDGVVIVQPTAGKVAGFKAVCSHAGCALTDVSGGTINCPCHGSKINLDGTVANGPADRPLTPVAVKVEGANVVRG